MCICLCMFVWVYRCGGLCICVNLGIYIYTHTSLWYEHIYQCYQHWYCFFFYLIWFHLHLSTLDLSPSICFSLPCFSCCLSLSCAAVALLKKTIYEKCVSDNGRLMKWILNVVILTLVVHIIFCSYQQCWAAEVSSVGQADLCGLAFKSLFHHMVRKQENNVITIQDPDLCCWRRE